MLLGSGSIFPTFVFLLRLKGFTKEKIVGILVDEEHERKEQD